MRDLILGEGSVWDKSPISYENLMAIIVNCIKIAVIIVVGYVLVRVSKPLVIKLFSSKGGKADLKLSQKRISTLQGVVVSFVKYMIYFLIIYAIADVISSKTFQPMVAVAGALGVAIGLGAQSLVKDIIAGFFIIFEDQYSVGDVVEIQSKSGTIEDISLRTTRIRGFSGELFIVPNGSIQIVTNWAKEFTKASFVIKVPYEEKIGRIMDILESEMENTAQHVDGLLSTPKILGITELGDYNIHIRITADCKAVSNWSVERDLRLLIKKRFEKENVLPPYPVNNAIGINKS